MIVGTVSGWYTAMVQLVEIRYLLDGMSSHAWTMQEYINF